MAAATTSKSFGRGSFLVAIIDVVVVVGGDVAAVCGTQPRLQSMRYPVTAECLGTLVATRAKGGNCVAGSTVRKLSCESASNSWWITVSMDNPSLMARDRGIGPVPVPFRSCFRFCFAPALFLSLLFSDGNGTSTVDRRYSGDGTMHAFEPRDDDSRSLSLATPSSVFVEVNFVFVVVAAEGVALGGVGERHPSLADTVRAVSPLLSAAAAAAAAATSGVVPFSKIVNSPGVACEHPCPAHSAWCSGIIPWRTSLWYACSGKRSRAISTRDGTGTLQQTQACRIPCFCCRCRWWWRVCCCCGVSVATSSNGTPPPPAVTSNSMHFSHRSKHRHWDRENAENDDDDDNESFAASDPVCCCCSCCCCFGARCSCSHSSSLLVSSFAGCC
mmetsp:Transcript_16988/g.35489  ORF Transcript_16988/g.35489 Transcript_16988/m.35489 type:complete len:387 (-) Transcript_16988:706-1866(-)